MAKREANRGRARENDGRHAYLRRSVRLWVRVQKMSSNLSTPSDFQTRQIRPINAPIEAAIPKPPTYPARPIGGGRLELVPKKPGLWHAEPKYNGWRALVHCPTGTMWNRHGGRLTIAREFKNALDRLRALSNQGLEWADCEALERRHSIGRGTLVVLDRIICGVA
jgi:hypothetical protein